MNNNVKAVALMTTMLCVLLSLASTVWGEERSAEDVESEFYKELKLLDGLQVYNQQMQVQIASQELSMGKLQQAKNVSKNMGRELLPLLAKMLDTLDVFVQSDIPFKLDERQAGVQQLKSAITGSESVLSDQYRQLFSLYQIEDEYGRSYEAYTGSLAVDDKVLTVDYLRIGRLGFYYQTKDGKVSAMWNKSESKWVVLPTEFNRHIRKAIRVAGKAVAPELINLPLIAPEGF